MRRMWFALFVATVGLTVAAPNRPARADEGSTGEDRQADQQEEQQIRTKLDKAPDLKNDRIDVKVDDGIAVLEGTVDSQREKKEAQSLAHVDGILGVNNRLQVRGSGK